MRCPICTERSVTHAFLCGEGVHVGCCGICLIQLDRCPFCRDSSRATRIFLYELEGDDEIPQPQLETPDLETLPPLPPPIIDVSLPLSVRDRRYDLNLIGVTIKRIRPIFDMERSTLELDVQIPRSLKSQLRRQGFDIDGDDIVTVTCLERFSVIRPVGGRIVPGAYVNISMADITLVSLLRICYPNY